MIKVKFINLIFLPDPRLLISRTTLNLVHLTRSRKERLVPRLLKVRRIRTVIIFVEEAESIKAVLKSLEEVQPLRNAIDRERREFVTEQVEIYQAPEKVILERRQPEELFSAR